MRPGWLLCDDDSLSRLMAETPGIHGRLEELSVLTVKDRDKNR